VKESDNFGLHTPCTTGFIPQSQGPKSSEILLESFYLIIVYSIKKFGPIL